MSLVWKVIQGAVRACEGREILVEMTVPTEWWAQRTGSEIHKTTAK